MVSGLGGHQSLTEMNLACVVKTITEAMMNRDFIFGLLSSSMNVKFCQGAALYKASNLISNYVSFDYVKVKNFLEIQLTSNIRMFSHDSRVQISGRLSKQQIEFRPNR